MESDLYADEPAVRLSAAARVTARQRKALLKRASAWPPLSPGALNAWLLLVTTKPPVWRDPLVTWTEQPPALGEAHAGFFYPDPLGFWSEVRHWSTTLVQLGMAESLAVTSLLHGASPEWALEVMHPRVVLFLDEPGFQAAGWDLDAEAHHIEDPYRRGKVYEGWWGRRADGLLVGKAPQHPAAHKFYRREDMHDFLRSATRHMARTGY
ncbi:MAG: hypothetical protein H0W70_05595 [Actinobacteria bacterium]|nr:hypothetical protein [Actinomycetota bacterium]